MPNNFPTPNLSFSGIKELRKRLWVMFVSLIVYRIGAHIPVPGLKIELVSKLFSQKATGFLAHFNMISGGALSRFTLFAVGLTPYIFVSIILQLLTSVIPALEKIKKEGESGRRKLNQYTRYGTALLSVIYSFGLTRWLVTHDLAVYPNLLFYFVGTITFSTSTLFLMWLGEQLSEGGFSSQGTSVIISAGILAGIPEAASHILELFRFSPKRLLNQNQIGILEALTIVFVVVGFTAFVIFMERAQRKILISHPQRQQGQRIYAAQTSYLPFKLNIAGIMPTIFASSVVLAPGFVLDWFKLNEKFVVFEKIQSMLLPGKPLYMLLLAFSITFFCFFYTAILSPPNETSDNLKKSGAFIPGIRPGEQTAHYIDKVMTRLTVIGCFYLILVVLLPDVMKLVWHVPFSFGGTSLLIVVLSMMEIISHMQTVLISHQYEPLLKKAKLKGISIP